MQFKYSATDRDLLIRTMLGEAAGEDDAGQRMVASVVLNRMMDPRWGGSISQVVKAPKQFSTWNSGAGGNNPMKWSTDSEAYQRAAANADAILSGKAPDETRGATHYYSPQGMHALVAEGSQGNILPGWLQQEAARRNGQNVSHGGHVFTGLASYPWLSNLDYAPGQSSAGQLPGPLSGSAGGPSGAGLAPGPDGGAVGGPQPYSGTGPQGSPRGPLAGLLGALRGPAGSDMSTAAPGVPGGPMYGDPNGDMLGNYGDGGVGASASNGPPGMDAAAAQDGRPEWLKKLTPKWDTPETGDKLLAIGAGLLSGDDWASGGAAAASNLLGVRQQQRGAATDQANQQRALMQEDYQANRDQGFRMDQIAAQEAGRANASPLQAMGDVQLDDGTFTLGVFNPNTGKTQDAAGNDISNRVTIKANSGLAGGDKAQLTGQQAQKIGVDLVNQRNTLDSYDRLYAGVQKADYGVKGLMTDVNAYMSTLAGNGLSGAALQRAINEGQQQALIGGMKNVTGNTGVMTDQDFIHLMTALGGDLSKIGTNPDAVLSQLKTYRDKAYGVYDQGYQQYKVQADKQGFVVPDPYAEPDGLYTQKQEAGPLTGSTTDDADIDAILNKHGL